MFWGGFLVSNIIEIKSGTSNVWFFYPSLYIYQMEFLNFILILSLLWLSRFTLAQRSLHCTKIFFIWPNTLRLMPKRQRSIPVTGRYVSTDNQCSIVIIYGYIHCRPFMLCIIHILPNTNMIWRLDWFNRAHMSERSYNIIISWKWVLWGRSMHSSIWGWHSGSALVSHHCD